jgi:acyl dehydratase
MSLRSINVKRISELKDYVGVEAGPTDWLLVTQYQMDVFAELTQDRHWIHIDQKRAREELAFGSTVAHGLLTLSLLPRLADQLLTVETYRHGLNYGFNRVRFTAPVRAGASIRLRSRILSVDPVENGIRLTRENILEVNDNEKPAMIAETVVLMYD